MAKRNQDKHEKHYTLQINGFVVSDSPDEVNELGKRLQAVHEAWMEEYAPCETEMLLFTHADTPMAEARVAQMLVHAAVKNSTKEN